VCEALLRKGGTAAAEPALTLSQLAALATLLVASKGHAALQHIIAAARKGDGRERESESVRD
jgi:hypothetical protein